MIFYGISGLFESFGEFSQNLNILLIFSESFLGLLEISEMSGKDLKGFVEYFTVCIEYFTGFVESLESLRFPWNFRELFYDFRMISFGFYQSSGFSWNFREVRKTFE